MTIRVQALSGGAGGSHGEAWGELDTVFGPKTEAVSGFLFCSSVSGLLRASSCSRKLAADHLDEVDQELQTKCSRCLA